MSDNKPQLLISSRALIQKLNAIKVLIFDWDGVFTSGSKTHDGLSSFSEIDSMGINMLRFGFYLKFKSIPLTYIVTGEKNLTARAFAKREHLDGVFYSVKNKGSMVEWLEREKNINLANDVLFFFDDILDLPLSQSSALRIMLSHPSKKEFTNYCKLNNFVDYITACSGGNQGLRESCEMLLSEWGIYSDVIDARFRFTETYQTYFNDRNQIVTNFYTPNEKGNIVPKYESEN